MKKKKKIAHPNILLNMYNLSFSTASVKYTRVIVVLGHFTDTSLIFSKILANESFGQVVVGKGDVHNSKGNFQSFRCFLGNQLSHLDNLKSCFFDKSCQGFNIDFLISGCQRYLFHQHYVRRIWFCIWIIYCASK